MHKQDIPSLPFVPRQRKEFGLKYVADDENYKWFIPTDSNENIFILQRDDVEDGTFMYITALFMEEGETVWFTPPSGVFELSYTSKWTF